MIVEKCEASSYAADILFSLSLSEMYKIVWRLWAAATAVAVAVDSTLGTKVNAVCVFVEPLFRIHMFTIPQTNIKRIKSTRR